MKFATQPDVHYQLLQLLEQIVSSTIYVAINYHAIDFN